MGDTLADAVRAEHDTALDRLGSEKALLALTDAQLEATPILEAVGAVLGTARATLSDWAADSEGAVADALADGAAALATGADRVADALGHALQGDSDFLALEGTTPDEWIGAGLVGVGLVLERLCLRAFSYFVDEADERRADLCRDLRETADGLVAAADGPDIDAGAAPAAAGVVVRAAYDEYAARLDAMGFDPTPIR